MVYRETLVFGSVYVEIIVAAFEIQAAAMDAWGFTVRNETSLGIVDTAPRNRHWMEGQTVLCHACQRSKALHVATFAQACSPTLHHQSNCVVPYALAPVLGAAGTGV